MSYYEILFRYLKNGVSKQICASRDAIFRFEVSAGNITSDVTNSVGSRGKVSGLYDGGSCHIISARTPAVFFDGLHHFSQYRHLNSEICRGCGCFLPNPL
jgi:hypothetical protein